MLVFLHMKKPSSLQPSVSRMQLRMRNLPALPPLERALACYCAGLDKQAFCASISRGDAAAVNLALDVVAAELWLGEHDAGRYGRPFRAALRRACLSGVMTPEQKRVLKSIEMRNWRRLVLRARHSEPGDAQQRAARRLPGQRRVMQQCFDMQPVLEVPLDEWPAVAPPAGLLQKGVRRGWFSAGTAEKLAASSYDMLMELLHPPIKVADPRIEPVPEHDIETISRKQVRKLIDADCDGHPGLQRAKDMLLGSFYLCGANFQDIVDDLAVPFGRAGPIVSLIEPRIDRPHNMTH